MRIVQVMAGAQHGGAETYFCDTLLALQQSGLEQIAVIRPWPERVKLLRDAGIEVVTPRLWTMPSFLGRRQMANIITRHKPGLIQAWMGRAASLVPRGPVATIGWFGGYYDLKRYSTCDDFIGVTHDIARHIVEHGAPAGRTHVIHTFAQLEDGPALDRATLDTPAEAKLILVLARLHEKKGIDIILAALAQTEGAFLWIAGEGPLREELETLAKKLGVADRVRFLGWRTDRGALLRAADLCVMPSRYEPFGTVMAEAWAAGTPFIATAAAGPAAYIQDGGNGLLVPIDDVSALTAAIRRALGDPALRETLVAGGRTTYEQRFTKVAVVSDYLALYHKIMREN